MYSTKQMGQVHPQLPRQQGAGARRRQMRIQQQPTIPPIGPQVPPPPSLGNQMGQQPHPFATTGIVQPQPRPRYPTFFPRMQGLRPPLWSSQPNVRRFPY